MRGRKTMRNLVLTLALLAIPSSFPRSETRADDLVSQAWKAWWIAHPDGPRREFGVFHFRKAFTLDSVPEHFVIHVSGDNRYELFVNGQRVVEGPARGDLNDWRYETVDIAPQLVAGRNLLAAVVWNYAELAPEAQITNETGFLVQGDGRAEEMVNTDESWKVYKSSAVRLIKLNPQKIGGYMASGPGEEVDASHYPWGWETAGYDDSSWVAATTVAHGESRSIRHYYTSPWMLTPRSVPLMEDKLERLARVARASGAEASPEFLQGGHPLSIPANSKATLLLDQSYLTTAYPELVTSGGRGATIKLTYAEAPLEGTRERQPERD